MSKNVPYKKVSKKTKRNMDVDAAWRFNQIYQMHRESNSNERNTHKNWEETLNFCVMKDVEKHSYSTVGQLPIQTIKIASNLHRSKKYGTTLRRARTMQVYHPSKLIWHEIINKTRTDLSEGPIFVFLWFGYRLCRYRYRKINFPTARTMNVAKILFVCHRVVVNIR